jgi:hypothetical protein
MHIRMLDSIEWIIRIHTNLKGDVHLAVRAYKGCIQLFLHAATR